jgi:hypothetical protein
MGVSRASTKANSGHNERPPQTPDRTRSRKADRPNTRAFQEQREVSVNDRLRDAKEALVS